MTTLPPRSERSLKGVHPDLVRVVRRAYEQTQRRSDGLSFIVIEGLRTKKRQQELLLTGASRTMNSRHLTGHAVDLMATVKGTGRWDWPLYLNLSAEMSLAAQIEGVAIRWGGTWQNLEPRERPLTQADLHKEFPDGPHYELDRSRYP